MCEPGSPEKEGEVKLCPKELPSGTKYRLTYAASGDYNAEGVGTGLTNRFGDTIAVEHSSKTKTVYTDTHGHKVDELFNAGGAVSEIKDVSGARATKYGYYTSEGHILETFTDAEGNIPNQLYHFDERYYDPTTGRWTQPDPEGEEGYVFAGDDPVNEGDPEGLLPMGCEGEGFNSGCRSSRTASPREEEALFRVLEEFNIPSPDGDWETTPLKNGEGFQVREPGSEGNDNTIKINTRDETATIYDKNGHPVNWEPGSKSVPTDRGYHISRGNRAPVDTGRLPGWWSK